MTITYHVGENLYVNLTNRCSAACDFCVRHTAAGVGDADSLWLDHEPTEDEVLASILSTNWEAAPEIVFCGYGEPTMRLDLLLSICAALKERKQTVHIRVNTNGHANMIAEADVTPQLEGMVDTLSISLNYPDAAQYVLHCQPQFGVRTYEGLLDFAKRALEYVPTVVFSVVDVLPPEDIERCRDIATGLGVQFRVRTVM